ncbi:MAG: hypothetical protein ACR2QM_18260 [Longimicrobiales bacterium]
MNPRHVSPDRDDATPSSGSDPVTARTRRVLLAVLVPLLVQAAGGILIIAPESGASGGPFAGIFVLIMFLVTAPITLVVNAGWLLPQRRETSFYLKRGMILPAVFLLCYQFYYSGAWDNYIDPLLPSSMPPISTASTMRMDVAADDEFFVLNDYSVETLDLVAIETYVRNSYAGRTQQPTEYSNWKLRWYFVPAQSYDPIDLDVSRANAVVVFENDPANGQRTLRRTRPAAPTAMVAQTPCDHPEAPPWLVERADLSLTSSLFVRHALEAGGPVASCVGGVTQEFGGMPFGQMRIGFEGGYAYELRTQPIETSHVTLETSAGFPDEEAIRALLQAHTEGVGVTIDWSSPEIETQGNEEIRVYWGTEPGMNASARMVYSGGLLRAIQVSLAL